MNFLNIFVGTSQSNFAAIAIMLSLLMVCLYVLFINTNIDAGKRFMIIFFILIASIPSILLTLFEITCMVTGGTRNKNPWCYWYAWILVAIIIVYSIIVIISVFISMFTYNNASMHIQESENKEIPSNEEANDYAKKMIEHYNNISDVKNNNQEDVKPEEPKKELKPVMKEKTNPNQDKVEHPYMDEQFNVMGSSSLPMPYEKDFSSLI
jgi:uncharacterized protein (UPF0333 family)